MIFWSTAGSYQEKHWLFLHLKQMKFPPEPNSKLLLPSIVEQLHFKDRKDLGMGDLWLYSLVLYIHNIHTKKF